jgi:transcriptional regulator with XRE-family HTH domain
MKAKDERVMKLFAKNLLQLRENKGLSQRQLAALSKVDHAKISKIESFKVNLTITTLVDLARGLGVHPKKLLDFEMGD